MDLIRSILLLLHSLDELNKTIDHPYHPTSSPFLLRVPRKFMSGCQEENAGDESPFPPTQLVPATPQASEAESTAEVRKNLFRDGADSVPEEGNTVVA